MKARPSNMHNSPANVVLKRIGPRFWLPTLLVACGGVLICAGCQNTYGTWVAFRLLLGLVEAGIYPGCSFVLSSWYSPKELHTRLTIFYSAASMAGAFSGLLAYAIGHLDYTWGYRGWRWIYVVEGLLAVVVGSASYIWFNPSPGEVKRWLTDEEREYLVLRNKYAAGGESGVKEKFDFSLVDVKKAIRSFHVYAVAITELTAAGVVYGISFVLPGIINNLGYSNVKAQAMSAPPYIFACVVTILSGLMADRYKQRALSVIVPNTMAVIGFAITLATVRFPSIPGVTYFGLFFIAGGLYPVSPAATAWVSLNMSGSTKRAAGIGLMIAIAQLGGVSCIRTQLFMAVTNMETDYGVQHLSRQRISRVSDWVRCQHRHVGSLWPHLACHLLSHFEADQPKEGCHVHGGN